MGYGKIKADTLVYDNGGSDVEKSIASLAASAPTADPTFTGTATFNNLTVNGTTTTVNSSTLTVTDKNIEIAKGAANDAAADGAGITIDSGDGDKTWNWVNATDAWTSSEHIALGDNKEIKIGADADFKAWHDGSHTRIENSTGTLNLRTNTLSVTNAANSENLINAVADGAVTLHHNGTAKLATSVAGVTVTGTAVVDGFAIDGKAEQTAETLTAGSTVTVDCSTGNYFKLTAGQNTTIAFSNIPASGTSYVCILEITAGSYTVTWPAAVKWPASSANAAPSLTASKVHNFVLATSDGGTNWRAQANVDYAS